MRILFITDHPFSEKDGKYYSGGGIPASMLKRYVRGDSELMVVGRRSVRDSKTLSSIPNSKFYLLDNYRSPVDVFLHHKSLRHDLKILINKADGVIMRLPSALSVFSYEICSELHVPVAIEVCGSAYDAYRYYGNLIGRIAAPITEWWHKRIISSADYVLYVTQQYLQKKYPPKKDARTIACSNVHIRDLSEDVLNKRLEKIENSVGSTLVAGQIGNVQVSYKGYSVMFEAMSKLKQKGIFFEYQIVGAGDPTELLEIAAHNGVREQVHPIGPLNHDNLSSFFESIDIYVHPSFLEGLSRSIVEAMSFACPVLSSNVAAAPELLVDDYLHSPGDSSCLASQLQHLNGNINELKIMAKRNFEHASKYLADTLKIRRDAFYDNFFAACVKSI